jgi:hypothetical protein
MQLLIAKLVRAPFLFGNLVINNVANTLRHAFITINHIPILACWKL